MRLMSKNPTERPENAGDVLAALQAIDVSENRFPDPDALGEGPETNGVNATSAAGSLESMAYGVFVGRHPEIDQLKARLESTLSGRGGMVTLVGEPGIGKTRTSLELETYAGLRNAQVLWGKCYEGGGARPYWPWVQAIRSYVDLPPKNRSNSRVRVLETEEGEIWHAGSSHLSRSSASYARLKLHLPRGRQYLRQPAVSGSQIRPIIAGGESTVVYR